MEDAAVTVSREPTEKLCEFLTKNPECADALVNTLADRLAERLKAFVGEAAPANEPAPQKHLLSFREAAKRLGISRTETLPGLIASRKMRTVTVAGRKRIPLHEVERVEREGATQIVGSAPRPAPLRFSQPPNAAQEAAKLRARSATRTSSGS